MLEPLAIVLRHRIILARTTLTDLKGIYAGSVLGLVWVLLGPALLMGLYAMVFGVIFKAKPSGMSLESYVLYVCTGLLAFLAFTQALSQGALSLTSNKQVLLNTVFPAELIPLRSVLVGTVALPTGVVLLLVGDALLATLTWHVLLLPVVIVLQVMFVTGVCWVLSLLNLVLRDTSQILTYVTMLLLVITPYAYTPDQVPAQLQLVLYLNPMFYFVLSFQSLIVLDRLPPAHVALLGTAMSVLAYYFGFYVCRKTKQAFYDYA